MDLRNKSARRAVLLAALAGMATLWTLLTWALCGVNSLWEIVPYALLCGPLLGLGILYGGGAILAGISSVLGGKGDYAAVRGAVGWSAVPINFALLLPLLLAFGILISYVVNGRAIPRSGRIFVNAPAHGPSSALLPILPLALAVLVLVSFLILVPALAEAQQFSRLRAAVAILVAPIVAVAALIMLTLSLLIG